MKTKRWMYAFAFVLMPLTAVTTTGCQELLSAAGTVAQQSLDPTPTEMAGGVKDALAKGLENAVKKLALKDGFFGDAAVKLLFPKEAEFAATKLRQIGMGSLVDNFEEKLNRAAEDAVVEAAPIFGDALRAMTFTDVKNILLGGETAATDFFKAKTSTALYSAFSPKINTSLNKVGAATAWTKVTTTYNSIPLVQKKVETDLVKYATNKTMDGLFAKIALEEAQIRKSPILRTTALMKKAFGWADKQKK